MIAVNSISNKQKDMSVIPERWSPRHVLPAYLVKLVAAGAVQPADISAEQHQPHPQAKNSTARRWQNKERHWLVTCCTCAWGHDGTEAVA